MSDTTDRLRAIANAAGGAYDHMVEDGRGIGALPRPDREAIESYDDTFGLDAQGDALVAAMLDVVALLNGMVEDGHPCADAGGWSGEAADEWFRLACAALARFREVADE